MGKKAALPNPTVTPPEASIPAAQAAPQADLGGIQVSEGGEKGDRPGPKPAAKVSDVSTGIGAVSAADLNDRRWEAKKSALRKLVQEQSDEVSAAAPKNQPLFGKGADEPIEGEVDTGQASGNDEAGDTGQPSDKPPEPNADELAKLAAKDRENRRLRKELKKVSEAPRGVGLEKLKELAKSNPRGVAEMLGISLEALNLAFLSGKPADPIKLEEEKPPKPAPVVDEEKEQLKQELAARRQRDAQRTGFEYGKDFAEKAKDEQGRAAYPNIRALGDEGVSAAMGKVFAFAGGRIDENGNPRARPVKMKPMTQKDGENLVAHFFELEERRLSALAAKLNPGNGKPQPRNPVRPMANGFQRPNWDPNNPHDPNNPRNRPDYRQIGDKVRARFFGPR